MPEGITAEDDVPAGFLDADHPGAIGPVDDVVRDQRAFAELGEEEGAHARTEDPVAVEDDPPAFLDMHRIPQRAEGVAADFHVLAADQVERALAWAAARRLVEGEVGVEETRY